MDLKTFPKLGFACHESWKPLRAARESADSLRPLNPLPDCLRCGACCYSPSEKFVRVTGDDWTRLAGDAEKVAHFIGHRAFMRMQEGHCAALEVRRSTDEAAEFFCTIYERRPQVCRDLQRGSPECAGERAITPPAAHRC